MLESGIMLEVCGENEALAAGKSADCTIPLKDLDTLIELSAILLCDRIWERDLIAFPIA